MSERFDADWLAGEQKYVVLSVPRGIEWESSDGDEWHHGRTPDPVTGEPFESAAIRLCGGPRHGEIVA